MKTKIIYFVILLLGLISCKKGKYDQQFIREFSITSQSNGYTYDISVALPKNYDPKAKHRSIYLLDKEWDLDLVSNAAEKSGNGKYYSDIIIGIGWGNSSRERDYTPTLTSKGQGGSDKFILFLKQELIPYIEQNYNSDTSRHTRCIVGHSFGGLFAAYCFTNHHALFGNYISLSPSLWYDEQIELLYELNNRPKNQLHSVMYSSMGGTESYGMLPVFSIWKQSLEMYYPNLRKKVEIINGQGHEGAKRASIESALRFYFENRN